VGQLPDYSKITFPDTDGVPLQDLVPEVNKTIPVISERFRHASIILQQYAGPLALLLVFKSEDGSSQKTQNADPDPDSSKTCQLYLWQLSISNGTSFLLHKYVQSETTCFYLEINTSSFVTKKKNFYHLDPEPHIV
jgi:hypothetical protein